MVTLPPELLTITEVSRRYGYPRSTLHAAIQQGRLPAQRLGHQLVTTRAAVEHWRDHGKHRRGPAPKPKPPTVKRKPGRPRKGT